MKTLKNILRLFTPIGLIILFSLVIVFNIITPSKNFNFIPVQSVNAKTSDSAYLSSLPVLKDYEKAYLKGINIVFLKENSFINFAAPKTEIITDNLYALGVLFLLAFFILTFWQFDKEKPFTQKLINYMGKTEIVLLMMWITNILRHYLINRHILSITNDEYCLDIFIWGMPEFWLLFIVTSLKSIIKKGLDLQQEQSLTI